MFHLILNCSSSADDRARRLKIKCTRKRLARCFHAEFMNDCSTASDFSRAMAAVMIGVNKQVRAAGSSTNVLNEVFNVTPSWCHVRHVHMFESHSHAELRLQTIVFFLPSL